MIRRITCAVGAALSVVVASLALASSALAAPSTPVFTPMPFYVPPDQQLSWTQSLLDANGNSGLSAYDLMLFDMTKAAAKYAADPTGYNPSAFMSDAYTSYGQTTAKLNVLFPNVAAGDEYLLCIRTVEVTKTFGVVLSGRSCRAIAVAYPFALPPILAEKYISINPDPGCLQCGVARFVSDDPETIRVISSAVVRDPTPIIGVRIDERGAVSLVYG
jgi:hypothetical protein